MGGQNDKQLYQMLETLLESRVLFEQFNQHLRRRPRSDFTRNYLLFHLGQFVADQLVVSEEIPNSLTNIVAHPNLLSEE